jgi:ABC-type Fe3+ transport system permease subunit
MSHAGEGSTYAIVARERQKSMVLRAWILSGLFFMALPGTLLGFSNLMAISTHHGLHRSLQLQALRRKDRRKPGHRLEGLKMIAYSPTIVLVCHIVSYYDIHDPGACTPRKSTRR